MEFKANKHSTHWESEMSDSSEIIKQKNRVNLQKYTEVSLG